MFIGPYCFYYTIIQEVPRGNAATTEHMAARLHCLHQNILKKSLCIINIQIYASTQLYFLQICEVNQLSTLPGIMTSCCSLPLSLYRGFATVSIPCSFLWAASSMWTIGLCTNSVHHSDDVTVTLLQYPILQRHGVHKSGFAFFEVKKQYK